MKILHIGKKGNVERFSKALPEDLELVDMPMNLDPEEYVAQAADAEHIIIDAIGALDGAVIRSMPNLKSIHSEGVAYNKIDLDAASECGVKVCHSVGMNATAVAEQAVLLMSGVLKDVIAGDRAVREGRQIVKKEKYMIEGNLLELADCAVGLVGFGNIASATAVLLRAYGVSDIYYYKRSKLSVEEEEALGVQYMPLDELLASSDIVSMHLPVTDATMGIANADFFSKMKPGAYFINTARGELVDDIALADALASGKLAMAGLDTLSHEPVQPDHYLLNREDIADKLVLSPHIGGITTSSFRRSYAMIWEDILTVREGGVPERVV
ncbi:MAG: NAD(P)-dependent oxidoreductase [Firmicutes bacterium]|nr:NAD(P)-dependent oxidoreductase [Bacillota bacterium]